MQRRCKKLREVCVSSQRFGRQERKVGEGGVEETEHTGIQHFSKVSRLLTHDAKENVILGSFSRHNPTLPRSRSILTVLFQAPFFFS